MIDISHKLRELRLEKNLKQKDVARALNIATNTLSQFESNNGRPSLDVLFAIADFFDVSVDYLIGRTEECDVPVTSAPSLTEKEKRLLKAFMQLSDVAQSKLIEDAEFYANHAGSSTHSATKKA